MVGGQWKVRYGGLVDHDIHEIMARHKQAAARLIRRAAPV